MKNTLSILFFSLITLFGSAQVTSKTDFKTKHTCSQKFGITSTNGDYKLTVVYDTKTIRFTTYTGQKAVSFAVAKKTEKYVIGKNEEGNYSFYDIKKKQFYYIDYFMKRYTTAGYGAVTAETKQLVLKMMALLKEGKTQQDVIQHLISQTKYDF